MSKVKKIIVVSVIIILLISVMGYCINKYRYNKFLNSSVFDYVIDEELDINKLKSYKLPIIIQFGADRCKLCIEMDPYLKDISKRFRGKAIIKYIDIWDKKELAPEYSFKYVPVQMFIDSDGNNFKPSKKLEKVNFEYKENKNGDEETFHWGKLSEENILEILKEMGCKE